MQLIRSLNSRLYSHLKSNKALKLYFLLGPRPISATNHTSSSDPSNLVVTIPSNFSHSNSERSVLAKGLKFVPNHESYDFHTSKADTESFFYRLRLKTHFHDQTYVSHKNVFEATNPKNPPGLPRRCLWVPKIFSSDNVDMK